MSTINGTNNNDFLQGTSGDDTINGLGGNDTLQGLGGNDVLNGGTGNDILTGGPGTDTLTGGPGADTFQDTAAGLNGDTITDFTYGDHIQITDSTVTKDQISVSGDQITFPGGSVTVTGLSSFNGRLAVTPLQGGGVDIHLEHPAANDFNGDTISDILWRNDNGNFTDWLGNANHNGGFTPNAANILSNVSTDWQIAGTGDFNGDGKVDVLWRNVDGRITDWLGNSSGGFTDNVANAYNSVSTDWQIVGIGDFNGDGRSDILWRNTDGRITDWLGNANGGFTPNAANFLDNVSTDWKVVAIGDFNGDGHSDIMWRNVDGRITNWLGTDTGSFTDNVANAYNGVALDWQVAGIGDFNGDGRDDILWRDTDGRITDWLSTASGGYQPNSSVFYQHVSTDWQVSQIGDFNGDGIDDILWRNSDGRLTDWLGTGTGSFTDNAVHALTTVSTDWHTQPVHNTFF
jgi:RPA family protein